jgi:hypothetical protein
MKPSQCAEVFFRVFTVIYGHVNAILWNRAGQDPVDAVDTTIDDSLGALDHVSNSVAKRAFPHPALATYLKG